MGSWSAASRVLAAAALPWALLRGLEFGAVLSRPAVHARVWTFSLIDGLVAFLVWVLVMGCLGLPPIRDRKPVSALATLVLSAALCLLLVSSWVLFQEFGEFLSIGMIAPLASDWTSAADYILLFLGEGYQALGFAVGTLACFALLRRLLRDLRTTPAFCVLVSLPLLVGLNWVQKNSADRAVSIESSHWITLRALRKMSTKPNLYRSHHRIALPELRPTPGAPNILLILGESWGADGLPFFPRPDGPGRALPAAPDLSMPFLESWLREEADQFLMAPRGFANSTDTKASVPSLVTGVSPERPAVDLHTAPFLWDWARAAGYQAYFATSERFRWAGFDQFLIQGFPGFFFMADTEDHPLVNDLGIDDAFTVRALLKQLAQLPPDRKFLAVFNPNAIHASFQEVSENYSPIPSSITTRFAKAHWLVDKAIEELMTGLKKQGRWDSTAVFFTGDHGSGFGARGKEARVFNLRDQVIRVPWMVRLPRSWVQKNPRKFQQARANLQRPVANIDILPSVVSLLGLAPIGTAKTAVSLRSGKSIFEETIPERRMLFSVIPKEDTAGGSRGGFALIQDHFRLVSDVRQNWAFFDLSLDPHQEKNLWDAPEYRTLRDELLEAIPRSEVLRRIAESRY